MSGEPSVIRHQRPEQTTPTPARGEAGANETTGLRKRKMKRVRILPKDQGSSTKARGSSRFSSQDLRERSLLFDPDETLNDDDKPENRDILSRTRLRSRTSSGSSDLASSSSGPNINIESIRQSFRRPSRTISNLTALSSPGLHLARGEERTGGPRAEGRRALHRSRAVSSKGERVDAVMRAPPNMKTGGLVVIKSYCRFVLLINTNRLKCAGCYLIMMVQQSLLIRTVLSTLKILNNNKCTHYHCHCPCTGTGTTLYPN